MKKTIIAAMAALMASPALSAAEPQVGSGETNGYKLVWQDLFDAGEFNTKRWTAEVTGNPANQELQYYTNRAENVSVGDDGKGNGCLILTAKREEYGGRHFTSGRVISNNKVNFTYGKVEAAIKLPKTKHGLWPAFWMMGDDIDEVGWPRCGETDILEMGNQGGFGGNEETFMNGAAHWGFYNNQGQYPNYGKHSNAPYSVQDGEFHLYTCIWTPDLITMYLDLDKYPDAEPYYAIGIGEDANNPDWETARYFRKPNFILFNLAVGGHFPGITNAAGITALNDGNGQEAKYYVNYVKIYQREADADRTLFTNGVDGDPQPTETPEDPKDPEDPEDPEGGIDSVEAGNTLPAIYFNLQGIKVANPQPGNIYIERRGTETRKIRF